MPIEILMPALSPTMSEGNLARWLKKEGDKVESGDIIAEIETDKATMEYEAVDEGTLGKIVVPEGTEGVAVNAVIGYLLEEGEDESAIADAANGDGPAKTAEPQQTFELAMGEGAGRKGEPVSTPAPETKGPPGEDAPEPRREPSGDGKAGRIFASPLAKRMAEQAGLDLGRIDGSGPHGRIVKADIERAQKEGTGKPAPAEAKQPEAERPEGKQPERPAEQPQRAPAPQPALAPPDAPHEVVKLNNMRKTIARRLTESKQTVPHFYLTIDCELDALLKMRKEFNDRPGANYKLSVNDFVIKASAVALRRVPDVNASWGGDVIYKYQDVDVAVAVAIPGGLITPVLRKVDQKGLSTLSAEMKDLAARARDGKLKPEEYTGGGFSVSNLGMYGIKDFGAIINPPQSAILAVGTGEQRPLVKAGAVTTATIMSCTLSVDHRVVDGALGAEWLKVFKGLIEDPLAMML